MKTWNCPRCGKETSGSYNYGGCPMALCWNCQDSDNKELFKREIREEKKEE